MEEKHGEIFYTCLHGFFKKINDLTIEAMWHLLVSIRDTRILAMSELSLCPE